MIHLPGSKHSNADALSRLPCRQCGCRESDDEETEKTQLEEDEDIAEVSTISHTISSSDSWASSWSVDELKSSQAADTTLNQMITWLSSKSVPYCIPKGSSIQLQSLWTQRHYLLLKDGILYRRWEDVPGKGLHKRLQLVLPQQLVAEVMTKLHDAFTGGHQGVKKTLQKVHTRFYWVGQRRDVEEWCRGCEICAVRKSEPKKRKAPLQIEPAKYPLEKITMDILGQLPETEHGNEYILVIGDYFT